ncbi:MAG: class I SAM-dependent methyltransferase [bacterium]
MRRESSKDKWEKFWQGHSDVDEVYSNEERIIRAFLNLGDISGKKILEVGAGTGRDSFKLASMGASVFVVDYALNAIKIIENLNKESEFNVIPVCGDAFKLPFKDETFDIVFHQGLLEHFRNPKCILDENYRVLRKGGYIVVDVPQRWHIYTIIKHILIATDKWFAGWETEYSYPQLVRLLSQCGFDVKFGVGEWMYPSLFYRIFREIGKKAGIKLPLYPPKVPVLWKIRKSIRERLRDTRFALTTGIAIGVVGIKR